MSLAAAERPALRIAFSPAATAVIDAGVPVLGGEETEKLFAAAQPAGRGGAFALFRSGPWLLGAATVPVTGGLEQPSRQLYLDLFAATEGLHLARIWNYVPAINETGPGGLENYRAFCQGRSLAFERQYGATFKSIVPAASAVGCKAPALTVVFAASATAPRNVENPLQIPAYDYPREYGPRAPSFARASIVSHEQRATVFISGTAAIRGHATVAPDGIAEQLTCALENLAEISRACGLSASLGRGGGSRRHFKVYVRRAEDLSLVAATLDTQLLERGDQVVYLLADICRRPLLVEIEATLFDVTGIDRAK
jgi:chorismate lyase/3-hydroxybenzoate synthase